MSLYLLPAVVSSNIRHTLTLVRRPQACIDRRVEGAAVLEPSAPSFQWYARLTTAHTNLVSGTEMYWRADTADTTGYRVITEVSRLDTHVQATFLEGGG